MPRFFVLASLLFSGIPAFGNPLFAGADPEAHIFGNEFWIYPTAEDNGRSGRFYANSSTDLQHWENRGVILDFNDIPWINDDGMTGHGAWAPSITEKDGKYYFYFAVGPQTKTCPSRIGVAVGDRPEGPFKDSGKMLVTGGNGFEAIDPMVFQDARTGAAYLYAGGSAGSTLRVWQLTPDMENLQREIPVRTPPNFTEGSFMHERNGIYYLSYSHGHYNGPDYSVHYAMAPSPLGPWTYRGCILQSDATHKGPGHHSFLFNPGTGEWFIVYHRWETADPKGPYQGHRQLAVERVEYNPDGTIKPIVMTDDGASPSSLIR